MPTSWSASRECGGVDVKNSATSFPPPLRGRDRERGNLQAQRLPPTRFRILSTSKLATGESLLAEFHCHPPPCPSPARGEGTMWHAPSHRAACEPGDVRMPSAFAATNAALE